MNKTSFTFALIALVSVSIGSSVQLYGDNLPVIREKQVVRSTATADPVAVRLLIPRRVGSSRAPLREVSTSSRFFDGDRFRLSVNPLESGYFYLVCLSAQGEVRMLYPFREDGDNYVERNRPRSVPGSGWFRFDDEPGTEHIYIIESTVRLPELDSAAENQAELPISVLRRYLKAARPSIGASRDSDGAHTWRVAGIVVKYLDLDHVAPY